MTADPHQRYMFLDERRKPRDDGAQRFVTSCIDSDRTLWDRYGSGLLSKDRKKHLGEINELLLKVDGHAQIGYADLESDIAVAGEIDGTRDIERMSRNDHLWSVLFLFTIGAATANAVSRGMTNLDLFVYHDPKDLKADHRDSTWTSLSQKIPSIAAEHGATVSVSAFEAVPKTPKGTLQHGTSIAHHLCRQSDYTIAGAVEERIRVDNLTSLVEGVINDLEARSRQERGE